MLLSRFVLALLSVGLIALCGGAVTGQDYPTKPIRIATSGVASTNDTVARFVAQGISGPLGQQVIVVNYSAGVVPGQTVAKAPADGYTLLVSGSNLWLGTLLQDIPYDPVRDFAPLSLLVIEPLILVVHPSLPVKTVKELIALAKARPGELNYASGGLGGSAHLAVEQFKAMAGVQIQGIPYATASARLGEFVAGQTQMMIEGAGTMLPIIKAGKLRGLAVTTARPSALVPGLPMVSESGLPGYEWAGRNAMFAPARTPEAIIKRLNQEIVRFLSLSSTKAQLLKAGQEAAGSTPEDLADAVKSEMEKVGKILKAAGIRAQ